MLQEIKKYFINNLKNMPGWHINRKIVTIECDDWGSIRMPSRYVYDLLLQRGTKFTPHFINVYDKLESGNDLEQLYEALTSVKDKNGRPAIMTAVTNVANPDFERIRASDFSEYYYEPFTKTLKSYYPDDDVFKLWLEGISAGIFIPELHGREHINVQMWLQKLREGDKDLLMAFDHKFVYMDIPGLPVPAREFGAELYFTSEDQKPFLLNSMKEAVSLFRDIFGSSPRIFVPPNGIFHPEFEQTIKGCGLKFLFVSHFMPHPVNGGRLRYRYLTDGQTGPSGITYYLRNCAFEPSANDYIGIDQTLKQIGAAFKWGKPAIISTHRVNFVGGIDNANREKGLKELKKILKAIIQKWPDIEFMNSADALEIMKGRS
jgi:hypothetical protein